MASVRPVIASGPCVLPACGQELERLRACGAVDYFCNHCNTLVSKRTVLFEAQPDKA